MAPRVSVVIPVRDNAAGVREVLRLLEAQTLAAERFEIVIGDDGSTAGSLAGIAGEDGRIRVVAGPPRTSYAARNRAVSAAHGSLLAFCDSDCLPEPTWLEEGLRALEHAELVAGEVAVVAPPQPRVWSLLTIDMFLDQQRNVRRANAVTANLFVRRELFDALGGFDGSLVSGGDYDFTERAVARGARLAYAERAIVRHPTIDGGWSFLRKVWTTNRWAGYRRARRGGRPDLLGLLHFVPILGVALARRHALRPCWHLHRPRLIASGLAPGWRDDLRALAVLYLIVAYVAGFARARGWIAGLGIASSPAAPYPEVAERSP